MRQDGRFTIMALRKSLFVGLIAVVVWGLLVISGIPRIVGLWEEILEREEELKKMEELEGRLRMLVAVDERELDSGLRLASWALPAEFDASRVVPAVSNQAGESGLDVAEYKAIVSGTTGMQTESSKKRTARKGLSSQKFSLAVSGSWNNWLEFLERMDKVAPVSRITGVRVSSSRDKEMSAEVDLVGYYTGGEQAISIEVGERGGLVEPPIELSKKQDEVWKNLLTLDYQVYEEGGGEELAVD